MSNALQIGFSVYLHREHGHYDGLSVFREEPPSSLDIDGSAVMLTLNLRVHNMDSISSQYYRPDHPVTFV